MTFVSCVLVRTTDVLYYNIPIDTQYSHAGHQISLELFARCLGVETNELDVEDEGRVGGYDIAGSTGACGNVSRVHIYVYLDRSAPYAN